MLSTELNELLKKKKILTNERISELEKDFNAVKEHVLWEDFLVDKKILSEQDLLDIKSKALGVPIIDLKNVTIPAQVLSLVPEPIAHRHKIISFEKERNQLSLAMMDPADIPIKEFIKKEFKLIEKVAQ
jgi:hypothetical protein